MLLKFCVLLSLILLTSAQALGCTGGSVLNLVGDACIPSCPANSIVDNSGQCVCSGSNLIDTDRASCVAACSFGAVDNGDGTCKCPNGFSGTTCNVCTGSLSLDYSTCTSSCPPGSSSVNGVCTCNPSYVLNGNSCICSIVKNPGGTGCLTQCPAHSSSSGGQCVCDGTFQVSGDGKSCVCTGTNDKISADGLSCISSCPARSSLSNGQCTCDPGFQANGNTCGCSGGKKINLAGTGCISDCPQYSLESNGACQCFPSFTITGDLNSCECPGGEFISVDGTNCISSCFLYSSNSNGQCVCDGALVANGNTCGCPGGKKINLAGIGCDASCPTHSSDQAGQCQCNAPWVIEAVNKASCVCPSTLQLSLDGLNCITPCPTHSIIVNNACVCDGNSNFVLASDKQSCECQVGTLYDPESGTCLVACSDLSPPNNIYPYCYQCDGTCKTCSGPNSNECLTCYSGYQLSVGNTCNKEVKSSPSTASVEAAKTVKAISSASLVVSSVTSIGNSGAMRVSLMGNMFQYLKLMNISYSEQLSDMLENVNSQFLPFDLGIGVPHSMTNEENYKTLPYQFTKYEEIYPSFLMNFWDDLSILVLVIGIVGILVGLHFVVNKFYSKKKTMWKTIFSKASLMAQNFLLTFTYNDLGSIIFFGLLDFKSAKKYSGVHILNLIIAIVLLLAEIGLLTAHYILLVRYRRIKRTRNRTEELEEFLEKHENLKTFFEDFNDFSFIQQGFLLVAIIRDMLSNLILVTLYKYPLAESTCFMVFSLLMIAYILYSGPFKEILNAIQQILCEGILLLVNTCVFINAVMDHIDSNDNDTRKSLGSIVVTSNIVFNFVPIVFLVITLWQFSKEFYGWTKKRKIANLRKTEELSLKTDSSNMILRNLSLEGPIRNVTQENRNIKLNEFLEILGSSQNQMMSKDNSGIFEVKLDRGQGQNELITEHRKEKSPDWTNENNSGIRRAKIKKRRVFPYPQQNALSIAEMRGEVKFEGHNSGK